jgi:hypothetical protein
MAICHHLETKSPTSRKRAANRLISRNALSAIPVERRIARANTSLMTHRKVKVVEALEVGAAISGVWVRMITDSRTVEGIGLHGTSNLIGRCASASRPIENCVAVTSAYGGRLTKSGADVVL